MNRLTRRPILPALLALAFAGPAFAQGEVNLYTHREPGLIKPLLDKFTAETGVKVNVVFAANGLAERIQSEGERSPADLLLSVDIATLNQAIALGVTQPVTSLRSKRRCPRICVGRTMAGGRFPSACAPIMSRRIA